uniref:Integrator complex subunit 3 N-terminal domain-containing protein n=1 Tax=Puya raimondii TaxID=112807 RepID=A0A8A0WIA0_PUYRA|nr:hypothetical protein PY_008312 [Puya raimondii]
MNAAAPPQPPTPPRLLRSAAHEAENPTELSLRDSFVLLRPRLNPPFPLTIPSPSQYSQLTRALAFAVLAEPHVAKPHLTHLHALVTDGYDLLTSTLLALSNESFSKLLDAPKAQFLWLCSKLIQVSAIKIESLVVSLLRQIKGGDFTEPNLWLCAELLRILSSNWDWLLDEPLVLTSALFVYLRLLSDHYRLMGSIKMDELKRMEIDFCIKALRQSFDLCFRIGRDLVRLLQDLVYIPEFRDLWKDLLFDPTKFKFMGFNDISDLYRLKTPSHYLSLRITPEMETQLRFLLTHVKWGSQKRYQQWFAKKHLTWPSTETLIPDIIRFVCCSHHPSNEIIQSNVISRWAVIGWLLKCCKRGYFEANAKLALFYDWLFFDEVDNVMNVEPAMLLMVNSVTQYAEITHTLMEFLFLLVDNYDAERREVIVRGVLSALDVMVRRGVVSSLEPLTSSELISPLLREKLSSFLSSSSGGVSESVANKC